MNIYPNSRFIRKSRLIEIPKPCLIPDFDLFLGESDLSQKQKANTEEKVSHVNKILRAELHINSRIILIYPDFDQNIFFKAGLETFQSSRRQRILEYNLLTFPAKSGSALNSKT